MAKDTVTTQESHAEIHLRDTQLTRSSHLILALALSRRAGATAFAVELPYFASSVSATNEYKIQSEEGEDPELQWSTNLPNPHIKETRNKIWWKLAIKKQHLFASKSHHCFQCGGAHLSTTRLDRRQVVLNYHRHPQAPFHNGSHAISLISSREVVSH